MISIKNSHSLKSNLLLMAVTSAISVPPGPSYLSAQEQQKEITAMILDDARPMQFRDEKTGKASGFAVNCMGAIARRAGFTVTYTSSHDFSELIGKLRTAEVDILPSLVVSEEHKKIVDVTGPVDSSSTLLFVRARDTSINGLRSGLRIGVLQGSIRQEQPPDFFRKGATR